MPTPAEYKTLLAGGCPWCGEPLVLRQGRFGEFIACSQWCGFTRSVVGRGSLPSRTQPARKCRYSKCDGSGYLPFHRLDGSISPDCRLFCDCHPDYGVGVQDSYRDLQPEDYDFPLSATFRAWTYEHCGQRDPGYVPLRDLRDTPAPLPAPTVPRPAPPVHRPVTPAPAIPPAKREVFGVTL